MVLETMHSVLCGFLSHSKWSILEMEYCNSANTLPRESPVAISDFSEIFDPKEGRIIIIS
jgi:hypothetical protein